MTATVRCFVEDRLLAVGKPDDAQAAVADADARRAEISAAIGAAVCDGIRHAFDGCAIGIAPAEQIDDACKSTHTTYPADIRAVRLMDIASLTQCVH